MKDDKTRIRELERALMAIKNDARLIRSLAHDNTTIANLATGIYTGARKALGHTTPISDAAVAVGYYNPTTGEPEFATSREP